MEPSIFVGYAHSDKAIAQAIASGLTARNVRVRVDEGELRVGDSLIERISHAPDEINFVVVLVSPNSVTSSWCLKEISFAMTGSLRSKGVKVLPLRIGGAAMPPALSNLLHLNVNPDDLSGIIDRLASDAIYHQQEHDEAKSTTSPAVSPDLPAYNLHPPTLRSAIDALPISWQLQNSTWRGSDLITLDRNRKKSTVFRAEILTENDWPRLRSIRLSALQDDPLAFLETYERAVAYDEQRWRQEFLSSEWNVTLLRGQDIGLVGVAREPYMSSRECDLTFLWIAPRFRRSGAGSLLVRTVLDRLRDSGVHTVWLYLLNGNEAARHLYERFGFQATNERYPIQGNPQRIQERMRLRLY